MVLGCRFISCLVTFCVFGRIVSVPNYNPQCEALSDLYPNNYSVDLAECGRRNLVVPLQDFCDELSHIQEKICQLDFPKDKPSNGDSKIISKSHAFPVNASRPICETFKSLNKTLYNVYLNKPGLGKRLSEDFTCTLFCDTYGSAKCEILLRTYWIRKILQEGEVTSGPQPEQKKSHENTAAEPKDLQNHKNVPEISEKSSSAKDNDIDKTVTKSIVNSPATGSKTTHQAKSTKPALSINVKTGSGTKPSHDDQDILPPSKDEGTKPSHDDQDILLPSKDGGTKPSHDDQDILPPSKDEGTKPSHDDQDILPPSKDGVTKPSLDDQDISPPSKDGHKPINDHKPNNEPNEKKQKGESKPKSEGGIEDPKHEDKLINIKTKVDNNQTKKTTKGKGTTLSVVTESRDGQQYQENNNVDGKISGISDQISRDMVTTAGGDTEFGNQIHDFGDGYGEQVNEYQDGSSPDEPEIPNPEIPNPEIPNPEIPSVETPNEKNSDKKIQDGETDVEKQHHVPQQPKFPEEEDSNFFAYFLAIVVLCIAGYLVFHNKQKIIALIVEGRHERRRRPNNGTYKRLDSKDGAKPASHVIF